MSSRFKSLLKLLVMALCFTLIARRLDGAALREALQAPRWGYLAWALAIIWCEPVVSAVKWRLLLRLGRGAAPPLGLLIRVVFTSNFLSLMAPTALGADALRLWLLRRRGYRVADTMSALLVDRVLGLSMLLLLAFTGWWYARGVLRDIPALHAIPIVCLLGLAALAAAFAPLWVRLLQRLRRRGGWRWLQLRFPAWEDRRRRIEDLLFDLLQGFQSYRAHPAGLAQAAAWNLLIQGMRILQAYLLFRALGVAVPFIQTLTFVPLIVIVTMLPISFYGLGLKEGAFWYFFAQVGIAREVSITVSLLTYPLILSALLPGAWFFLRGRDTLPPAKEAAALQP